MNRKATFLVVLVFVLGLVLGGLSTHLAADRFGVGRHGRADRVAELTRELGLNAEQQKQLAATLEETRAKFHSIYEQMRPQTEQARQEGRQKIRAFLTGEQLPKFEAWLQRYDDARKKRESR